MVCTTKADVFIRRQVQWYELQPGMEDDALAAWMPTPSMGSTW